MKTYDDCMRLVNEHLLQWKQERDKQEGYIVIRDVDLLAMHHMSTIYDRRPWKNYYGNLMLDMYFPRTAPPNQVLKFRFIGAPEEK